MKVLHVIPSTAARDGGPAVAIREMTAALARAGTDVSVATTDADGPREHLAVPLGRPVRDGGVTYWFFARTTPGEWKLSVGLFRWLLAHAAEFDVVHVHAIFSFATLAACRTAKHAGVPYVLRPLGTLDPWSLQQKRWKKRIYYRLLERQHLTAAAAIHATSDSEREGVRLLGFGEKVRVVRLGVPVVEVGTRGRERARPLRLLFLSRLHPGKGIPLLLQALRDLRRAGTQVELTIAGSGPAPYREELEALSAALGLGPAVVRFVGHVAGETKRRLLAEADAFVLPSSHENFGIAVAEALAAGLPVVISDQVGIAADVTAADAGRVVPLAVEPLAKAIDEIARDNVGRLRMGQNAMALARQHYSWEHAAQELQLLYGDVAGARSAEAQR